MLDLTAVQRKDPDISDISDISDIDAVIFDWGGTLTPWHDIDLYGQWYAYAEAFDPVHAATLARRLTDAEITRWQVQKQTEGAPVQGPLMRSSSIWE